nr:MAG TPA: hypothetical protein [Caudoviricetes sp.]
MLFFSVSLRVSLYLRRISLCHNSKVAGQDAARPKIHTKPDIRIFKSCRATFQGRKPREIQTWQTSARSPLPTRRPNRHLHP